MLHRVAFVRTDVSVEPRFLIVTAVKTSKLTKAREFLCSTVVTECIHPATLTAVIANKREVVGNSV
jgi:hypothetical protein